MRQLLLPSTKIADVPVSGTAQLRHCPLPRTLLALPGGAAAPDMDLDGSLSLRGTAAAPALDADLRLSFPQWPQLSSFVFGSRATCVPGGRLRRRAGGAHARRTGSAAHARVAHLAGELTLAPAGWQPQETGLDLSLVSQNVPLVHFSPLLPANTSLDGTARVQLAAKGTTTDADLDGTLELKNAKVAFADGNRVTGSGTLQVRGTAGTPQVRGDSRSPGTHPDPRDAAQSAADVGITAAFAGTGQDVRRADTTGPAPPAPPAAGVGAPPGDVDVTVTIPSGLLMRGRGLDAELAGKLHLQRQEQGMPTVVGQLETIRGSLRYLGRIFQVDRGVVSFYGDDTLDPTLDISSAAACRAT